MTDIMLIGEAWGEQEARQRTAFVGPTGYLLTNMLTEAGIRRSDCYLTNVFNFRPQGNKIETLCGPREQGIQGYPSLMPGKYVSKNYVGELRRLVSELEDVNPNVVVCLGNTACWALLGKTSIGKLRGIVQLSTHIPGYKVVPTFHPAAIFRQWSLRPVTVFDLMKAKRESEYRDIRRPKRKIWIEPTLEDIYEFDRRYIQSSPRLAVDIETAGEVITCIGFAPATDVALVVPFLDPRRTGRSYWSSADDYREARDAIGTILSRPTPGKVFQNGLYDITFIYRAWGIKVYGAEDDTMLLHHALQPEQLKGLEFLGSVYTDEGPWKQMRRHKTTIKRED